MAAQEGSLDMSIGFWCGAVPSSLTIPETLVPEGGAAFTPRCETWTARASRSNPEKIAINLCEFGFLMISFSRVQSLFLVIALVLGGGSWSWGRCSCRSLWVWIDRLQPQLFCDFLFLGAHGLQCAQVEHQVPGLVGLHVVGKRRHRRTVEAGHEDTIEVAVFSAALEPGLVVKVERLDRPVLIIRQGIGGRTVPSALNPVTLPALQFLKHRLPSLDPVRGDRWRGRNLDRCARLLRFPSFGEMFDVSYQVCTHLVREWVPGRHVGAFQAPSNGVEQIFIAGQSPGRCRAAFERGQGEVTRLGIQPHGILSLAIAQVAMTASAITAIIHWCVASMPGQL